MESAPEHAPASASTAPAPRGHFVGVGHNGLRLVSPDGATWSNPQVGKEGEIYRSVAFGNGRFVAVGGFGGSNIFAATRDGAAWQTGTQDARYSLYIRGLGFGNGGFMGLGGDPGSVGDSKPFVTRSDDGIKWSENRLVGGKNILRRVAFGGGRFVAVGDRGRRATTTDGVTWKDAPDVKAIDTLVDVTFGKGVFVGVGLNGLRMASTDGLAWTDRTLGEEGEHCNSVVFTGDRFVAVGQGATFFSSDGHAWTRADNKNAPLFATYGNGVFVGSHWKGRILRSTDAVRWEQVYKSEFHVEAICYGSV